MAILYSTLWSRLWPSYILHITDAANDIEQENNEVVKVATHYNKLFSASASLCSLIILLKALLDDLTLNVVHSFKESGFQIILKLLPHTHFRFRIFNHIICRVAGCSILHLLGVCKNLQFLATSPHYILTTYQL